MFGTSYIDGLLALARKRKQHPLARTIAASEERGREQDMEKEREREGRDREREREMAIKRESVRDI